MKPSVDTRRSAQLRSELVARARVWLPEWRSQGGQPELGAALLSIAARLGSEVTQRLDRLPEKTLRGFYSWLALTGQAGLAARLPVVFRMTSSTEPVDALAGTQLQATASDASVMLETEAALRVLPGRLAHLIGVDAAYDAFALSPIAHDTLAAPEALPNTWQLKSAASPGATRLQLEPALGLSVGMSLVEPDSGLHYRVTAVEGSIVSIEPRLGDADDPELRASAAVELAAHHEFQRVQVFEPFAKTQRNDQKHALYLGATDALSLEAAAWIEIQSMQPLATDAHWAFWGIRKGEQVPRWVDFEAQELSPLRALLSKPAGSVEVTKVDGISSRWLRATRAPRAFDEHAIDSGGLQLRINCAPGAEIESPALEAIANTAPLVLNAPFFPLGREPRVFDAFYIASKEAFSKPNATIKLEFTKGEEHESPLAVAAVGESDVSDVIASVGADGRLRLALAKESDTGLALKALAAVEPPIVAGLSAPLHTGSRPGATSFDSEAYFSVAAKQSVFLHKQKDATVTPNWSDCGSPPGALAGLGDTAVVVSSSGLKLYALSSGRLYQSLHSSAQSGSWQSVAPELTTLTRMAAFERGAEAETPDELLCVSSSGELYHVLRGTTWTKVKLTATLNAKFYPLGIYASTASKQWTGFAVVAGSGDDQKLCAFRVDGDDVSEDAAAAQLLGKTLSWSGSPEEPAAVVVAKDAQSVPRTAAWEPFHASKLVLGGVPPTVGVTDGPVRSGSSYVYPGTKGAFSYGSAPEIVAIEAQAPVHDMLEFESQQRWSEQLIVFAGLGKHHNRNVLKAELLHLEGSRWAVELPNGLEAHIDLNLITVYGVSRAKARRGTLSERIKLRLAANDRVTAADDFLYLRSSKSETDDCLVQVKSVDDQRVATLYANVSLSDPNGVEYWNLDPNFQVSKTQRRATLDTSGLNADVRAGLERGRVQFSTLEPALQTVRQIIVTPPRAVLASAWTSKIESGPTPFKVVASEARTSYRVLEPELPRNPDLFWEYWNGSSWWRLPEVIDGTGNFVSSGTVEFQIPKDLRPTDVVGRQNHWVRARLVGGDFGQESVAISSTPGKDNSTVQKVTRMTDTILAPYVIRVELEYSVCTPITPDFVLSQDADATRNQSDANRVAGATVEHFVPLVKQLSPLDLDANAGRALYLGFDAPLQGGPIQVLFNVDDASHDAAFPLRVEALLDGKFRPITSEDGTRGLSESGVVSFSLAESPRLTELFGKACYWLRLRPGPLLGEEAVWQPRIRGAYLNAVYALAAETQTLELLGSSDGSPGQRVTLARAPVLANSLVLCVREPLSDDEIAELIEQDEASVTDVLGTRQGPWVRWQQVVDPSDYPASARVYSLDQASGDIRFGDGVHGRIPPIGRDAIMARRYLHGDGVIANAIHAWSPISLLTPLAGVDVAAAPFAASGGADPETAPETLRFAASNLSMRQRALTLRDLEQLALQFSRDIAQARAFRRGAGARLIVVLRGADPLPHKALRRELLRYLQERSVPAFAAPGALQITGPELVAVRVNVAVTISALEQDGYVRAEVSRRIRELLDPAQGGDGTGWPLAHIPSEADIAASLVDIPHLDSLDAVSLLRVGPQAELLPVVEPLRSRQLLHLVSDGVRVQGAVLRARALEAL